MNQLAVQRQSRPLLQELPQLFNGFSGFPAFAGLASLRSFFDGNVMRLEDEHKDGFYEVRAELPGVDPIDDIEVTVHEGRLTIKAERTQDGEAGGHSEFSYGSFARTVALPTGADEDDINATYDRGILTVTVALSEEHPTEKRVEVIETILVEEEDDDRPELDTTLEHTEDEDQHQPAS